MHAGIVHLFSLVKWIISRDKLTKNEENLLSHFVLVPDKTFNQQKHFNQTDKFVSKQ